MTKCCPKHIYDGIQLCKGPQDALGAVVPLGLALTWYEGYTPVRMKSSARLLKTTTTDKQTNKQTNKKVQGDSFGPTEDAVPHWPRLDVCRPRLARNLNSRRLLCLRFTGGKIRRQSLWSKVTVSGSVLFRGRRGCVG